MAPNRARMNGTIDIESGNHKESAGIGCGDSTLRVTSYPCLFPSLVETLGDNDHRKVHCNLIFFWIAL
jgi:hypothetical protein